MKTIYVKKGKEYHSVIECIYQEDLFFKDIYRRARDCTEEILQINEQLFRREEDDSYMDPCKGSDASSCADASRHTNQERLVSNRFSNVIAFCANRGQGKTSVMLSYSTALSNLSFRYCRDIKNLRDAFWQDRKAKDARYEVLNSIDPTGMEAEDSLLKIVLSQMFARFQEMDQCRNRKSVRCDGNNWEKDSFQLQQKFLRCFHLANILSADKKRTPPTNMEDELEFIAETGGGMNLRTKLYELIDDYLNFVMPDSQCQKYLVIPIDDADLDVGRVYGLLEDIRKYLQLPRVIILLATNITQLESIVEQHFFKEYEKSISLQGSMVDVDQCHQISERYLEKILPGTRRLYLPNLNEEIKNGFTRLRISYLNDEGDDLIRVPNREETAKKTEDSQKPINAQWGYQEQLLNYLHRKTGLVFVAPQEGLHDLLPNNMRELMHFLLYFSAMKDVKANYLTIKDYIFNVDQKHNDETLTELRQWRENLKKFQAYLLEIWSASNLRTESRNILVELSKCSGRLMHQYLLQALPGYYAQKCAQRSEVEEVYTYRQQFINECAQFGAYSVDSEENRMDYSNDCYADVLTALRILEEFSQGDREQTFIYAIRLYYSIHMHQMLIANLIQPNDNSYYLTEFLGNGLFKEETENHRMTPSFSFGLFKVSSDEIIQLLDDGTQQARALISRWFRQLIQEKHKTSVRHISVKEPKTSEQSQEAPYQENQSKTWIFSPMYYLLAEVDNLTSYKHDDDKEGGNESVYVKQQYASGLSAEMRMIFALTVLLNGEVQEAFRRALIAPDSKAVDKLHKRITSPYETTSMVKFWNSLNGLNYGYYQKEDEIFKWFRKLFESMFDKSLEAFDSMIYLSGFSPNGVENIKTTQTDLQNAARMLMEKEQPGDIMTFCNRIAGDILHLNGQMEILKKLSRREFTEEKEHELVQYIDENILDVIKSLLSPEEGLLSYTDEAERQSQIGRLLAEKYKGLSTQESKFDQKVLKDAIDNIINNSTKVFNYYYYDKPLEKDVPEQTDNHTEKEPDHQREADNINQTASTGSTPGQNKDNDHTSDEGKRKEKDTVEELLRIIRLMERFLTRLLKISDGRKNKTCADKSGQQALPARRDQEDNMVSESKEMKGKPTPEDKPKEDTPS